MNEPGAFSSETVLRLTEISRRRLSYWLREGVLLADIQAGAGRGTVRLFSFKNLVEIRVALWLRDRVSLQLIRKMVAKLREVEGLEHPLSEVSFAVIEDTSGRRSAKDQVVVKYGTQEWEHWDSGQKIMELVVPLRQFTDELRTAADRDRKRARRVGEVEKRRGVLGSAPVIAGTRIPVRAVWSLHTAGYSTKQILKEYPGLKAKDIAAAISSYESGRKADPRRRKLG